MSAPRSEKAKGPEPLGSSPFRWCEWGDLNSMNVVSFNHGVAETLTLPGCAVLLSHVVFVFSRILLPICYQRPRSAPWHMSVNRTGVRGVDALYWMRVRVAPKWFEVTPKWFRVGVPDCESLVFRRFVWVRVDGWSCLAPSYSEMVRSYSEVAAKRRSELWNVGIPSFYAVSRCR